MVILGINNMHDASAVLVVDGVPVAAAEEERFIRVKNTTGFPVNAIRFCLQEAGITIRDVDAVCTSWKPWALRIRATQAIKSISHSMDMFRAKLSRGMGQMNNEWAELFRLRHLMEKHFGKGPYRIHYIDHHLSHAASAFLVSGFDESAIITVDGAGESETLVTWLGRGTEMVKKERVQLPHSLGQFYSAVTSFLGFKSQSDEYKVMGLASFGQPVHEDFLMSNVASLNESGLFTLDSSFIDYHLARRGLFGPRAVDVFGDPRKPDENITQNHADVAASAQKVIENTVFHVANRLQSQTGLRNLCLAGGVAFNCVANGKLFQNTPFERIFIQPAAGDAGAALGAALIVDQRMRGRPTRSFTQEHAYWGPSFSSSRCRSSVTRKGLKAVEYSKDRLVHEVARYLSEGKLIAWFQGRMEWGPRALGNRSFLADPRQEQIKDKINLKIKKREKFRPFAPSILEEKCHEYFSSSAPSPFMQYAFEVRHDKRDLIPAVTHVDGTARPQTVSQSSNPLFRRLISEFENLTGIPVILNTSFNVQEPIVCTPEDALECFSRTEVDYLVLENILVQRRP